MKLGIHTVEIKEFGFEDLFDEKKFSNDPRFDSNWI